MPELPPFHELERALKCRGVMPVVVARTILELKDHYLDLVDEAGRCGLAAASADAYARAALGDEAMIADVVMRRDDLLRWSSRYPFTAACCAMPLVPIVYCAQHRESLARWGLSCGLATVLTAALLLSLYSLLPL